jgi:hypothetical protein
VSNGKSPTGYNLDLRAGDWVEVRAAEEIYLTLDDSGCLDAMPFMPEMLKYCGRTFKVYKVAHKTCDTIEHFKGRRMTSTVHLEGLRCDGAAHGGCQAQCLLFWKEAWLKRSGSPDGPPSRAEVAPSSSAPAGNAGVDGGLDKLRRATVAKARVGEDVETCYSCQATAVVRASSPLAWWEPGQYVKDLFSGNVRLPDFIRYVLIAAFNVVMRLHWRGRPRMWPRIRGLAEGKTPTETLNLQPGELVTVRSREEIMRTINAQQRNRGLWFDVEMVPYCGKTYRVLHRVEKIINEKTGVMMHMPNPCIILEGVTCSGCLSQDRLFCPRSIYPYWREIWLKRVE